MNLQIGNCTVDLETLSDDRLLELVLSLRSEQAKIEGQVAALAAERFSRRQSRR